MKNYAPIVGKSKNMCTGSKHSQNWIYEKTQKTGIDQPCIMSLSQ